MQNKLNMFEKMFAHIAFGLQKKLRRPNPEEFTYGLLLRQGINMFSALTVEFSGMNKATLKNYLESLNETEMICQKFTLPVREWFAGWDESVLQIIKESCFWNIGPLIYLDETEKTYSLSDECLDYLDSAEKDLSAIDEHEVFNLMKDELSQDNYVYIRKFIISHPLLTDLEKKELFIHFQNNNTVVNLFNLAYEEVPSDTYHCPNCGWTMSFRGLQPDCCHRDCVNTRMTRDNCKKVEHPHVYRLKKGVMRYICYPGKAELEIEEICKKLNVKSELWPEKDRYDIKIMFTDGTCWAIDAKTYSNPHYLSKKIATDWNFRNVNVDKGYYVIPDKIVRRTTGYLKICNKVLPKDKNFQCVSLGTLKRMIKEQEGNK